MVTEEYDLCGKFWQPQIEYGNIFSFDSGFYEVIEELGFFSEVGLGAINGGSSGASVYLPHSVGYRVQRIKGTFVTPMTFTYFPYDCQSLQVRIAAKVDTADIYRFAPSATLGDSLKFYTQSVDASAPTVIAGWNITGIYSRERMLTPSPIFTSGNLDGAIMQAIGRVQAQTPVRPWDTQGGWTPAAATAQGYSISDTIDGVPYYSNRSEAIFVIHVKREPHSYVYNFALLVALLIAIAFTSFLFPSNDVNARVGLALTVFLGVIFFQILIVESLPRTKSFTTMHMFMFLSSIFNGVVCIEHVLVYILDIKVGKYADIVRNVAKLGRSQRIVRCAVRLQRAYRRHRIRYLGAKQPLLDKKERSSTKRGPSIGFTSHAAEALSSTTPEVIVQPVRASAATRATEVSVVVAASGEQARQEADSSVPAPLGLTRNLSSRIAMAEKIQQQSQWRIKSRKWVRDGMILLLANINWCFTVFNILFYFIIVLYFLFLRHSDVDKLCNDPWKNLDNQFEHHLNLEE